MGLCAVGLARHAGAQGIATVRSERDELVVKQGGAHETVRTDGISADQVVERLRSLAPKGMDHIVEVAFHANITTDEKVLAQGGSLATYATGDPAPSIPFWPLVFKNIRLFFLGSDDFPAEAKATAEKEEAEAKEAEELAELARLEAEEAAETAERERAEAEAAKAATETPKRGPGRPPGSKNR